MHRYLAVCIVKHRPPPCAATIHKTYTAQLWNRFQENARIQDQRSMCWQHTEHIDLNICVIFNYYSLSHCIGLHSFPQIPTYRVLFKNAIKWCKSELNDIATRNRFQYELETMSISNEDTFYLSD